MKNGQCVPMNCQEIHENCKTCNLTMDCTECNSNYTLTNGECWLSNCYFLKEYQKDKCLRCVPGYQLYNESICY